MSDEDIRKLALAIVDIVKEELKFDNTDDGFTFSYGEIEDFEDEEEDIDVKRIRLQRMLAMAVESENFEAAERLKNMLDELDKEEE
jgi:hypothetical protein